MEGHRRGTRKSLRGKMPCDVRVGRGPLGRQDTRKGGSTGKKRERKSKKKIHLKNATMKPHS